MELQSLRNSGIISIVIGISLTGIPILLLHGIVASFEQFELDSYFQEQYSIFFLPVIIIGVSLVGFGIFIVFLTYQK